MYVLSFGRRAARSVGASEHGSVRIIHASEKVDGFGESINPRPN